MLLNIYTKTEALNKEDYIYGEILTLTEKRTETKN